MNDHPNAKAFLEKIAAFTVKIAARFDDDPDPPVLRGTGFVIGHVKGTTGPLRPLVITAGHVIDHDLRDRTEWFVSRRTAEDGEERTARFTTPNTHPQGPRVSWYKGAWYSSRFQLPKWPTVDVGYLVFPNDSCEGGFLRDTESPPKVINEQLILTAGTSIAWAGYPGTVRKLLGRDLLCYYHGVVSASLNADALPPHYLIDGHNTFGVSGGPVWWTNERTGQPEIVGIVTHYGRAEEQLPGFVLATPINLVLQHLRALFKR